METNIRKRDVWDDDEVMEMLEVIQEKHIIELLDNKTKRNKLIYEEVADVLRTKKMNKTSDQIRAKFKCFKSDYFNMKRKNNKSGAQRHTNKYFNILEEMLAHRPTLTAEGVDTSQITSTETVSFPPATTSTSTAETSTAGTTAGTSTATSTAGTTAGTSTATATAGTSTSTTTTNTFRITKKTSYEKVVKAFTEEWKKTQNEVLEKMERQNEMNFEALREHRLETERILENNRLETAKLLESFIQLSQRTHWQPMPYFSNSQQPMSPYASQPTMSPITPPQSMSPYASPQSMSPYASPPPMSPYASQPTMSPITPPQSMSPIISSPQSESTEILDKFN